MSGGLAQRAVACKGWRWMPGMLVGTLRIDGESPEGRPWRLEKRPPFDGWGPDEMCEVMTGIKEPLPDLTDPATLGCLLALVLAAHGFDPSMDTWELGEHPDGGGFFTICDRMWTGMEFADALVAALEAAP